MTVRELMQKLLEQGSHLLDEEIKLCMMSHNDQEAWIDFRITSVDENSISFRPKGVTSNKTILSLKLPECKTMAEFNKNMEDKNGHQ